MNPIVGNLFVWVGQHAACIRITGRANFALSVEFRKLLQHLHGTGHPNVALDLSACQLMDSTFLGVLAHEAGERMVRVGDQSEPGLELWNPGANLRELIDDLGVAHLFKFLDRDTAAQTFDPAPAAAGASREELTRTCLEAHELLMALNPANVAKFQQAAKYFAEELKRGAASGSQR
jgi:anti-sigma B factor antagonist